MKTFLATAIILGLALPAVAETAGPSASPATTRPATIDAAERRVPASAMSEADRTALRAEIRSYLLDHPEVLMEAIAVLDKRRDAKAAADDAAMLKANADAIFHDPDSWVGGNPSGDVTLVEFMDYRCGYCRKALGEVADLVKSDGNIRFVVKEFPILGAQSDAAARFAIAVRQLHGDAAYAKVHEALMTMAGDVTPASLAKVAAAAGVGDLGAVRARMDSPMVQAVIDANLALGQKLAISGTPTFVVEDTMLRGYVPLAGMRQIVAAARKG